MSLTLKDNLTPSIRRLAKGIKDKRPILEAMGLQLQSLALRAFNEPALRPKPWPNKRDGTPSTLRKDQALHQSLRRPPVVTQNSVTVSSDRVYAAIHQLGGVIRPKPGKKALRFKIGDRVVFVKKVVMPARPFFPFDGERMTDTAQRKIAAVALAKIKSLTQPGT